MKNLTCIVIPTNGVYAVGPEEMTMYSQGVDYTLDFAFDNTWADARNKTAIINGVSVPIVNNQCLVPKVSDDGDVHIAVKAEGLATAPAVVMYGQNRPVVSCKPLVIYSMADGLYANQPFEEFFTAFVGGQPVPIYLIARGLGYGQETCVEAKLASGGAPYAVVLQFNSNSYRFSADGVMVDEA